MQNLLGPEVNIIPRGDNFDPCTYKRDNSSCQLSQMGQIYCAPFKLSSTVQHPPRYVQIKYKFKFHPHLY